MKPLLPGNLVPASDPGPDPELQPLFRDWRRTGRDLVAAHHADLGRQIAAVERKLLDGRYAEAAAAAQVAANHAVLWHPGHFATGTLDAMLDRLGAAAIPAALPIRRRETGGLHVLHVATQVGGIGGHVRMIWRWISQDRGNRHSVALTRQTSPLPEPLVAAVGSAGGAVHHANRSIGGILSWARNLQPALAEADLIVLHVHNQDIVPFLALAGLRPRPPVLLLNHADHVLWVGAGLVDGVVSTRRSGHALCAARRGIPAERNFLLPLCLEAPPRRTGRAEARRRLGLPEESVVILTIARAVKFRSLGGRSFADALVPVLQRERRSRLVVIGPQGQIDWSEAEAAVPSQILALPERSDTGTFYEAADIYLDSFPFPSITSLFEAGLRELPLVTRYPYGAGCEVMGADSVGIDEVLVRTRNLDELRATMASLVGDARRRTDLGARTRADILATNTGDAWQGELERLYDTALSLSPRKPLPTGPEAPHFDDLDLFSPYVFGTVLDDPTPARRLAHAREIAFKTMPPIQRLLVWGGMAARREFAFRRPGRAWSYLVPEWLTARWRVPAP